MENLDQRYLDQISSFPRLSEEEEVEISKRSRNGDTAARNQLVRSNLRLVITIALRYRGMGVGLRDLVAEGNLGLIRAAELYNPDQGARFSTYAGIWIKQKIVRILNQHSGQVRIPEAKHQQVQKWKEAERALVEETGHTPSVEEVRRKAGMTLEEAKAVELARLEMVPLDKPVDTSNPDRARLSELIEDPGATDPGEELMELDRFGELLAGLDSLSDQELKILCRRYGLDGMDEADLGHIGEKMNLSRERIRQKQELAVVKARREIGEIEDSDELREKRSRSMSRIRKLAKVGMDRFRRSNTGKRGPKKGSRNK